MPLTGQRSMNTDNTNTEDSVSIVTIESLFTKEEKATHVGLCKSIDRQVLEIPATLDELPELKVLRGSQSEAKPKPVVHEALRSYWKMEVRKCDRTWDDLVTSGNGPHMGTSVLSDSEAANMDLVDESTVFYSLETESDPKGIDLLVYWKRGFSIPFGAGMQNAILQHIEGGITQLERSYPPPVPKPNDIRHKEKIKSLQQKHGDSVGVYYFAWWYGIGQQNASYPALSSDMRGAGKRHEAVRAFIRSIAPLQQIIGILFLATDPQAYATYFNNFRKTAATTAWDIFATSRRACFHGLAVLRNLQVGRHKDKRDRKRGWTAMVCIGQFRQGFLVLPQLNLRVKFEPGDVIFFRASFLEHFLEEFQGERSALVFFTHASVADAIEQNTFLPPSSLF